MGKLKKNKNKVILQGYRIKKLLMRIHTRRRIKCVIEIYVFGTRIQEMRYIKCSGKAKRNLPTIFYNSFEVCFVYNLCIICGLNKAKQFGDET